MAYQAVENSGRASRSVKRSGLRYATSTSPFAPGARSRRLLAVVAGQPGRPGAPLTIAEQQSSRLGSRRMQALGPAAAVLARDSVWLDSGIDPRSMTKNSRRMM